MFRNVSSRGEDPRQSSTSTKNRIFGMDCDDSMTQKKKHLENVQKAADKFNNDLELADCIDQASLDEEKQDSEKSSVKDFNPGLNHNIRYSSFMDEQSANQSRIHEQKMQQKKWLDQQIAERKVIDRKTRKSEVLAQESIQKYDAYSSSQSDRIANEKRDMQTQIREYNEKMAMQKRVRDKQEKEMDKREWNDNHNHDLRKDEAQRKRAEEAKEELIEEERAMSREMLQMNTNNQKN